MGRIDLPFVDADTSIIAAVRRLIEMRPGTRVSAVVTVRDGRPAILMANELIAAGRANPHAPVSACPEATAGIMLDPQTFGGASPAMDAAERELQEASVDIGVAPLFGGTVRVFTSHEYIEARFRSDHSVCCCTGPITHPCFAAELQPVDLCPDCGAPCICG